MSVEIEAVNNGFLVRVQNISTSRVFVARSIADISSILQKVYSVGYYDLIGKEEELKDE